MIIKKSILGSLTVVIAMLFVSLVMVRCANIAGSPEGGPRDSLPPKVVAITPANNQTNMDTIIKRIYIEFDEFVQVKDQQTNFFSSPQMKSKPQMTLRGRGIVITLRDTLRDNTTYALNFGSSIQDNNESNPLTSFRYVFSTGDTIDSMMMSGYTEDGYSADSVSKSFIFLYPKDSVKLEFGYDSTLLNQKPSVIGRAEDNGTFFLQNLKPIPYYVYAVEDTNSNMTYEHGTDRAGFLDEPFNPAEGTDFKVWYDSVRRYVVSSPQMLVRLFDNEAFRRQLLTDQKRDARHKATLYFGANNPVIDSIRFDSIPNDKLIIEPLTEHRDTLALWFNVDKELLPDTLRGMIYYYKHDSVRNVVPAQEKLTLAWREIESKKQQQEREKQERDKKRAEERGEEWVAPVPPNPFVVKDDIGGEINPERPLVFDFDYPLVSVDTAAITLNYTPLPPKADRRNLMRGQQAAAQSETKEELPRLKQKFTFERDTQNLRRWYLTADEWAEGGSEYKLTIPDGTFTDIQGFKNDSIVKEFTPYTPSEYATVVVNVVPSENRPSHYVLELLNNRKSLLERKTGIKGGDVTFNFVPEGEVTLRVIEDRNNNGKWDTGDLIKRVQPEKSALFTQDGESKIITKVNWEIDVTVDAEKMFRDESAAELSKRLAERDRKMMELREQERLKRNKSSNEK